MKKFEEEEDDDENPKLEETLKKIEKLFNTLMISNQKDEVNISDFENCKNYINEKDKDFIFSFREKGQKEYNNLELEKVLSFAGLFTVVNKQKL